VFEGIIQKVPAISDFSARFLESASYNLLWQSYVQTGEEIWEEAVGLGWFFGTYRGRHVIHHDGSDPGFDSTLAIVPAEDAAVVVLANANTAAVGNVTDAALDVLVGVEPQLPKSHRSRCPSGPHWRL
jgi:CubicO group peptidase (beta-lactamase class C family)